MRLKLDENLGPAVAAVSALRQLGLAPPVPGAGALAVSSRTRIVQALVERGHLDADIADVIARDPNVERLGAVLEALPASVRVR